MIVQVDGIRDPDARNSFFNEEAQVIALGTVKQVMPARWTTSAGQRPANPHEQPARAGIVTPVLLDVEQYLKGKQQQPQLLFTYPGGAVNQDHIGYEPDIYTMTAGQRVVVFLQPERESHLPPWSLMQRYIVTPDGQAVNTYRTIPLDQLTAEVQRAKPQ